MITNQYVIELPNLHYDKSKLKSICDSATNWNNRVVGVDGRSTTYQILGGTDVTQNEYVIELIAKFSPVLNINPNIEKLIGILRMPPDGGLDAHLDVKRQAVVIFPIQPEDPAPIYYAEGTYQNPTKILFEHQYTCATIINAQILHGIRNDSRMRDTLQFSLMTPWEDLLTLNQEGKILV